MIDIGQPRWWPLTGIFGVILIGAGALLPGLPPPADAPAKDVLAYFQLNPRNVQLGAYLGGLGVVIWLWFSVAFFWVLRKTEVHAVWSLAYFGAVVMFAAVSTVMSAPGVMLSQPFMKSSDGSLTLAFYSFFNMGSALASFAGALVCVAASILILRSAIIARWIGWLGMLCAFLLWAGASGLYIASGPFAANGPETLGAVLLYAIWTFAIAIALMLKRTRGPAMYPEAESRSA